jgi:Zn-dependent M28 family amino/carboxypeptidase
VPTFSLGMKDGLDFRNMIGSAAAGQPVRLQLRMDVQQVTGLKTGTVWGRLPGTTDETIYIEAHRDGWFEAATDNASGVATLVGLAEHFSKIPQSARRRTIVFVGTSGHHNSGPNSAAWLAEHQAELFKKAALLINCEHTAAAAPELLGEAIRLVAGEAGFLWYGGGNQRPKLQEASYKAFQQFGVPIYAEPENGTPGGEASRLWQFVPAVQASNYNMFFHSDAETPATVPAPGLAATTRAYAKIVEEVNKMELKDLQLAPPAPTQGR